MKKGIKKVVLAYSAGLDTSIIIPWLKENYDNCEVIAVSGNVGQADELDGLEEKAIKTGASKLYIEDLNTTIVRSYKRFARFMYLIDSYIFDGVVYCCGLFTRLTSWFLSKMQTGNVQTYLAYSMFILMISFGGIMLVYSLIMYLSEVQ